MTENAYHKTYTLCATWMKHVFNQSTERNSLYFLAGKKFTLLWQVLDKGNVPFPLPLTTEPEVSMVIFHCPLPVAVDLCSSASAPSKWFSAVITHCTRRHIFGFWVFFCTEQQLLREWKDGYLCLASTFQRLSLICFLLTWPEFCCILRYWCTSLGLQTPAHKRLWTCMELKLYLYFTNL